MLIWWCESPVARHRVCNNSPKRSFMLSNARHSMAVAGDLCHRSLTAVGANCSRTVHLVPCEHRNGNNFSRQCRTINETANVAHQATTITSAHRPRNTRNSARSQAADSLDPMQLSLVALARRCAAESDHFYHSRPYDARFAHELFRRALVERDEIAWEHVYIHYSPLVESWVRRSGAFAGSGESSEFFVGAAFTKFWRAVSPERFATFPTLAAL